MSFYYLMVEKKTGRLLSGWVYGSDRKEAKKVLRERYGSLRGLQILKFK